MRIIKLLYINFSQSLIISIISSLVIFFIFSLIGNLNEEYLFKTIINLSILNSIQILTYVPAFLFLITIILFSIFLRSNNEIIIIKSYLNIKKLMIFFLPIVIMFSLIEINKNKLSIFLEDSKANLINKNHKSEAKIIVKENKNKKTFLIFKNIDIDNIDSTEFRYYEIYDNKIKLAEFSDNLMVKNKELYANDYTLYKNDLIKDYNDKKLLIFNLNELIKNKSNVEYILDKNYLQIDIKILNILIFFILFFHYIFFSFLNSKIVSSKENLKIPILSCLGILLYSFFAFNNSLSFYKQEFELIASLLVGMFFLKVYLNE